MGATSKFSVVCLSAVLLAASAATTFAQQCQKKNAVWVNERDGVRYVIYGTDGFEMFSAVNLEEWRDDKLAWRAKANVTCSNGVSVCYLLIENASGLSGDDATTSIVVEQIDEHGDGLSEWVVLAGMDSALWYSGGAKVEWFNGFKPKTTDERVIAPNIYSFESCHEAAITTQEDTPKREVSGQLFGIPDLCKAYLREGSLIADTTADGRANDGLWWLDDKNLVGWEFECDVTNRTNDSLSLSCSGEGETWEENRKLRKGNGWIEVSGVRLNSCR